MNNYFEHTVVGATRWDTLAWSYYNDPYNYSPIIEANHQYIGLAILPPGAIIKVPILSAPERKIAENLPPWKR